mmetsp:Transcript_21617/g.57393  ORF Transcript_21617/g.57393 Transcript_21617/m.57393 type:complete len:92 (+) Transcript_21617:241-516(+)
MPDSVHTVLRSLYNAKSSLTQSGMTCGTGPAAEFSSHPHSGALSSETHVSMSIEKSVSTISLIVFFTTGVVVSEGFACDSLFRHRERQGHR